MILDTVEAHKKRLTEIWNSHIEHKRKMPTNKFEMPGPGTYETKAYIQEDPSFWVYSFQKEERPLNKTTMKE